MIGKRNIPREEKERGSILLITLLVTGIVAVLSLTMGTSIRDQLQLARDGSAALHSELAAQSGLEFARRQLLKNPVWTGTAPEGLQFGGASTFAVTRLEGDLSYTHATDAVLAVEGRMGSALTRIEATIHVNPGDPVRTKALASLGGKLNMEDGSVQGDLLITDSLGVVNDYIPGTGWVPGGAGTMDEFEFEEVAMSGNLLKYDSQREYFESGVPEITISDSVNMPAWDLEDYLDPGPDRVIFQGVEELKDVTLDETAVFVLAPGADLKLENVSLKGGVVVYTEGSWNLRGAPRNRVVLSHQVDIGGGQDGIHPSIGLIAPASEILTENSLPKSILGFSFWHSAHASDATDLKLTGQIVVVNEIDDLEHATIVYDPKVAKNPPLGIQYFGSMPAINVTKVRESYDDFEFPDYADGY